MVSRYSDEETRRKVCGALKRDLGGAYHNYASSYKHYVRDAKHYIQVFVIEPDVLNKNLWGVTKDAHLKALQTLVGRPIVGPPNMGHGPETNDPALIEAYNRKYAVGKFIDAGVDEKGNAYGIAEVTDDSAWGEIAAGRWSWVSPQIKFNARSMTTTPDGAEVVHAYVYNHVAFVDKAAYGKQATILDTCTAPDVGFCNFGASVDEFIANQVKEAQERLEEQRRMVTEEEFKTKCAELTSTTAKLHEAESKLTSMDKRMAEFEGREKARLDEQLVAKATEVAGLKIAAGLARAEDKDKLVTDLKALGANVLESLATDFQAVVDKIAAAGQRDSASGMREASLQFGAGTGDKKPVNALMRARDQFIGARE